MILSLVAAFLIEKDRTKLLSDFPEVEVRSPFFGCNDDIDTVWKMGPVLPKELSNKPLDSIPLHGVSGSLTRRDSQPPRAQPAPGRHDGKMFGMGPLAEAI